MRVPLWGAIFSTYILAIMTKALLKDRMKPAIESEKSRIDGWKYSSLESTYGYLQPRTLSDESTKILMNHATKEGVAAIHKTKERIKSSPSTTLINGHLARVGYDPSAATPAPRREEQNREPSSELPSWTEIKMPTGRIRFKSAKNSDHYSSSTLSPIAKNEERYRNKQARMKAGSWNKTSLVEKTIVPALENLPTTLLENSFFKFNGILHGIEWKTIIKTYAPFLNKARRNYILTLSGAYSLNPLILLTTAVVDEVLSKSHIDIDDDDFRHRIRPLAEKMARHHLDNIANLRSNAILDSIRAAFNEDYRKLQKFATVYDNMHNEIGLSTATEHEEMWLNKRGEDVDNTMQWPWPSGECWELSASHGGAIEGLQKYIPSSLDAAPSLYNNWKQNYDFLGSNGTVVAMHDGTIYKHSSCSIEIKRGRWSTYYGHVDVLETLQNGTSVQAGDVIGEIELRADPALCLCDWAKEKYSCSNGPHLHFEARKDGMPISLNNMVIGGIQIRTGKYERDTSCTDPQHCLLAKDQDDIPCATYFIDAENNLYCPSVRGNTGGNFNYGRDPGWKIPSRPIGNNANPSVPELYECTRLGCHWDDYDNKTDWGFYYKNFTKRSDILTCESHCTKDQTCGAFEWTWNYCSWWRVGVCQNKSDATMKDTHFTTCRKTDIDGTAPTTTVKSKTSTLSTSISPSISIASTSNLTSSSSASTSAFTISDNTLTNTTSSLPNATSRATSITTVGSSTAPSTPENCEWSAWEIGDCSKSCGGGTLSKSRKSSYKHHEEDYHRHNDHTHDDDDVEDCPEMEKVEEPCNLQECPVQVQWSNWNAWGGCSNACKRGNQRRTRACRSKLGVIANALCESTGSKHFDNRECNTQTCCDTYPPKYWSECKTTCRSMKRQKNCRKKWSQVLGGKCKKIVPAWHRDRKVNQYCRKACRVCTVPSNMWDSWSGYIKCSATCGLGVKTRTRSCKRSGCEGEHIQTMACNDQTCPQGTTTHIHNTTFVNTPTTKLSTVAETSPIVTDSSTPTPVNSTLTSTSTSTPQLINGVWGSWSSYGNCNKLCGGGKKTRKRKCNNPAPENGGSQCKGAAIENVKCNTCPCDSYPKKMACVKKFSCKWLAKHRKCKAIWKRVIPNWCASKLSDWAQKEKVRNFCRMSCQNCNGHLSRGKGVEHHTITADDSDFDRDSAGNQASNQHPANIFISPPETYMKMRDPGLARSKRTASDGCAIAGNKKCNPLTWDEFGGYRDGCCTTDQRCGEMEGDCSDDSDCLPGLVCGSNNCPNNTGFAERADCCELYSHVFTPVFRYKRLSNTGCKNNWYGSFTEIQEAKIACKEDDNCSAVYDVECGNGNKYHLCPEEDGEGEDVWINSAMSCIHLKLIVDPCKEIKCGIDAICKVVLATRRAFCACPYLMVGDPYQKCEGEQGVPNAKVKIELHIIHEVRGISWNLSPACESHEHQPVASTRIEKECVLAVGNTYTLICRSSTGNGWNSNYLVIENKAYCQNFTTGSKETTPITILGTKIQQCPVDFPFAYNHGKNCCHERMDDDGSLIHFLSTSCKDGLQITCPKSRCNNYDGDIACTATFGETYNQSSQSCQCGSGDSCISKMNIAPFCDNEAGVCKCSADTMACQNGHVCVAGNCTCGKVDTCDGNVIAPFCDAKNNKCKCSEINDACANPGEVCENGECRCGDGPSCKDNLVAPYCDSISSTCRCSKSTGECMNGHVCVGGRCMCQDNDTCVGNQVAPFCHRRNGTERICKCSENIDACTNSGEVCNGGECLCGHGPSCENNLVAPYCDSISSTCRCSNSTSECMNGHVCVGGNCMCQDNDTCVGNLVAPYCHRTNGTESICKCSENIDACTNSGEVCNGGECLCGNGTSCENSLEAIF